MSVSYNSGHSCSWFHDVASTVWNSFPLLLQLAFSCHEGGASCLVYAPAHQLVISAGRKGDISIFDLRQRSVLQTLQAHSDSIKSLVLAQNEEFFVSGSADGSVKVSCILCCSSYVSAVVVYQTTFSSAAACSCVCLCVCVCIQVWDVSSPRQLFSISDQHGRSSFFRASGSGVQQLLLNSQSRQLFSCGADGMVKCHVLPDF